MEGGKIKMEMNEAEAKAYLKKKKKEPTKEEVDKVMTEGKIYGDPVAVIGY